MSDDHIPNQTDLAGIADRIKKFRDESDGAAAFGFMLYRHESIDVEAALRARPEGGARDDQVLALNSALEREAVRKTVADVVKLALEGTWQPYFQAGLSLACEEIEYRLELLWGEREDTGTPLTGSPMNARPLTPEK